MLSRLIFVACGLVFTCNLSAQTCNPDIQASTPDARFTHNGDGTVTDQQTGLIWKRCLEGQSGADCMTGTPESFTWQQALQRGASQSPWRLPNIKELASIVELHCYDPAINLTMFPNDPGGYVWSGSPYAAHANLAWYVDFDSGHASGYYRGYSRHVRLVRDGQ
ncbi:DUF1566 domain-containing protein [Candidatus Venteria ishoeyi]|uniref:Lcl C-terminal domain-containing protein n=1 Tax=Candidatus Venteria ishoeyi TaxID=1899563 RepID=UPI0025A4E127|nr:DUF1566 domain-containing protein [Candidatus Venteria ishoeyi]MDM8544945.1 DUF1566 domain-containing protein [Candidatus Venteria ishoeyi]